MVDDFLTVKSAVTECYRNSEALLSEAQRFVFHMEKQQDTSNIKSNSGLMNMKNQEIISCLTNSALLICKLSVGESVNAEKIAELLIQHCNILNKFQNLNPKLKSQVDRLIGSKSDEGKGSMHARPYDLMVDSDEDENVDDEKNDDEEEEENESDLESDAISSKILTDKQSTLVNDEEDKKSYHRVNRIKKRALNSSLVKDLRQQYSDAPEEIVEGFDDDKFKKSRKYRQKYEEDYFTRLPVNKREKHLQAKKMERSGLDSLLSFGKYNISKINGGEKKQQHKQKGKPGFKDRPSTKKKFKKSFKKKKHFS